MLRRYIVEFATTPDDRVEGTVHGDRAPEAVPFCGWTQLLRLLEPPPLVAFGAGARMGSETDLPSQLPS
jgi:hypothetical protein